MDSMGSMGWKGLLGVVLAIIVLVWFFGHEAERYGWLEPVWTGPTAGSLTNLRVSRTDDGWINHQPGMAPRGSYPCDKPINGVMVHGHCWK